MKIFLIADDSPVIRKVLRRIVEDLGFVVVEAADCIQAQQLCVENMPDGILVDWEMPGMCSNEFIEWLSPLIKERRGKILYCTSEVMVPEMTKAKRAGADGFLMKPFDKQLVIDKFIEVGLLEVETAAA